MRDYQFFTSTSGLNTRVDPSRVRYSQDTGVTELVECLNITIDDSGRPSRRGGYSSLEAGEFHSLFSNGLECYVIKERENDAALMRVNSDFSLSGVRSGLTKNKRMAYASVYNEIYYTNSVENGKVIEGISSIWPIQEHPSSETIRDFQPAPLGNHLEFFRSLMFISVGNTIYWSEPAAVGLFDMSRCFTQFPTKVLMMKTVEGGMFVSDETTIYFLSGSNPEDFVYVKVADYPAYEWSECKTTVRGNEINMPNPGLHALWVSKEGLCIGAPDGTFYNATKNKLKYPKNGSAGAGVLVNNNFIHSIEV